MLAFLVQLKTYRAMRTTLAGFLAWMLGSMFVLLSHGAAFEHRLAAGSSPTMWAIAHMREAMGAEVIRRNGAGPRCDSLPRRGLVFSPPESTDGQARPTQDPPAADGDLGLPPLPANFFAPTALPSSSGLGQASARRTYSSLQPRAPPRSA